MTYKKKLIEVALSLEVINKQAASESPFDMNDELLIQLFQRHFDDPVAAVRRLDAHWGKDTPEGQKARKRWTSWLLDDKASQIVIQAAEQLPKALDTKQAQSEIGYLENNLARMTYGTFRKAGYFISSGVVEAGCKTVVGKRMKCSGMFWSEEGGQGILDLRCGFLSNRLDTFCHGRASACLPRQLPLKLAA
jgi:hypothetical protein